jgi:hypothetical protein
MQECENKLDLIAKLIDSNTKNESFKEFQKVLYKDFINFSNKDNFLANETKMFLKLQEIEKELSVISSFSKLYTKNVVAVGGGFSAGKSEFISSFIESEIKLPVGVVPTTAIPSYVLDDEKSRILAISFKHSAVEVDKKFYSKLSHDFISSFKFNLKEIMPFMIIASKMKYKNLCFIDTPGYNPAKSGNSFTSSDLKSAKEFLENSNILIWLIGADSNGTISSSDLEFLDNLNLKDKKLFVVLNKASLKPLDELEDIIEEISFNLDDYDIEFEGISAYDSKDKKEYFYKKMSLFDFLNDNNKPSSKHSEIIKKLKDIYSVYKYGILKKDKENKAIYDYLKSISLDMFEDGIDENSAFEKIGKLKENFSSTKSKKTLKELDDLFEKLKDSVDKIFKERSYFHFEELQIDESKIEIDFLASDKEENFNETEDDNFLMDELNKGLTELNSNLNRLKD